ncbi:hypothetical protein Q7P35_004852 [Cladosporium inversicolor]
MLLPTTILLLALTLTTTAATASPLHLLHLRAPQCTLKDAADHKPCKTDCLITIGSLVQVCQPGVCVAEYRGPNKVRALGSYSRFRMMDGVGYLVRVKDGLRTRTIC